ncbi:MAG: ATP/GTP-binding protein [Chromatiaceae bacterium]|nr:ATP/GTP-binding protein [Chromatiaceae bacterium]
MNNHKIIFTGPVGAGKSTAIAAVSDAAPVVTEAVASDMVKSRKPTTTVALDYGLMNLGEGERVHLYGTPGQERFDFMWDILSEGGIGLILLLNDARPKPLLDLEFFLGSFKEFITQTQVAIGVTQTDLSNRPDLREYQTWLSAAGLIVPLFEVDAREKRDVSMLIESLLASLDYGLEG